MLSRWGLEQTIQLCTALALLETPCTPNAISCLCALDLEILVIEVPCMENSTLCSMNLSQPLSKLDVWFSSEYWSTCRGELVQVTGRRCRTYVHVGCPWIDQVDGARSSTS